MKSFLKSLFSFATRNRSARRRSSRSRAVPGRHALRIESLETRQMLSWTVMNYIDGDNNLADEITLNFGQMAAVGSTSDVKIVAQVDSKGTSDVFDGEKGAHRGLISQNDTLDASWGVDLGNVDSGDPDSLIDFVQWATDAFPADHYVLIIWDHGGGINGACWDETSNSHLSMLDLTEVMNATPYLDVLAFDACMMGMTEIAYQFRGEADVLVASEEVVPGSGFDYQPFLAQLVADPNMTPGQLGSNIVDAFGAYYDSQHITDASLAAIDLDQIGTSTTGLAGAIERFSDLMLSVGTSADWTALQAARDAAQQFGADDGYYYRDLLQMMTTMQSTAGVSASIADAAGAVADAVTPCVLHRYAGSDLTAYGLSIDESAPGESSLSSAYDYDLSFVVDTQWKDVAENLGTRPAPGVSIGKDPSASGKTALFVYGTDAADVFSFSQLSNGDIRLITSMAGASGIYRISAGGHIYVRTYDGNDTVIFQSSVTHSVQVYGGEGNDYIVTVQGNDVINGGPGNDVVWAGDGNDTLVGGDGIDALYGQAGNDRLYGGADNDVIAAGSGKNVALGGFANDSISAEGGQDLLIGGIGDDVIVDTGAANSIFGGQGADTLIGGSGADVLFGGAGNDVIQGLAGSDQIDGGAGNDWIDGGAGDDILRGSLDNDVLYGSSGNNVLLGGAGADYLYGGTGRNLLIGGTGTDWIYGGADGDILIGGTTSHDAYNTQLTAIMTEWTSNQPLNTRIAHLNGTLAGGLNGTTCLTMSGAGQTVFSDGAPNELFGIDSQDWFLAFPNDRRHG